jgi:hypothetical protein
MKRIPFAELPWQTSASGVRFKVQRLGVRQFRLLEFTHELDHPRWCETGHVGFVLEGTMEVAFAPKATRSRSTPAMACAFRADGPTGTGPPRSARWCG